MALTRARMCELLGRRRPGPDAEELFTVGMLSAADALLGMQLEQIVERLPLADQVVEALLRRRGPSGAVLDVVLSYERGDFARIGDASTRRDAARAYPDALRWAEGVLETAG
jgi:EAL and modified HD-GYP domain-containing signal transduction protein